MIQNHGPDAPAINFDEKIVIVRGAQERAEFYRPLRCSREGSAESVHTGSLEPVDDNEAEEAEIKRMFQGRLLALRWLPRSARPGALRAAREWLKQALDGLKEKRARERHARYYALRQLRLTRKRAPE